MRQHFHNGSLVLSCYDVQSNPGPDAVDGSIDSVTSCSSSSIEYLSNHLSIMHLNIQSIVSKLDLIEGEASAYDVLVFSESWLNQRIPNASICIEHFSPPFRADRPDRPGGGVIVYVCDTLSSKRQTDLQIPGLKAVWVEIQTQSKTVLVGGLYRPPNSNANYYTYINESIDMAYSTDIRDIIVLGDFNMNMLNVSNNNKRPNAKYSIRQLITEPTNFTEHSSTLIDLILVRNTSNILTSGVLNTFIPSQIRYHCPTVVKMKFIRPQNKHSNGKYGTIN